MNIYIQVISIFISFIFGVIFSILTNINYRYLFSRNRIFKIFFTVIYVLDGALFYFLIMKKINNGIIHVYFLLFVALGFIFGFTNLSKYVYKFKTLVKKCLKSVKK